MSGPWRVALDRNSPKAHGVTIDSKVQIIQSPYASSMRSILTVGLQKKESVREIAGQKLSYFILIAIVAGLPAFLEGFDNEIYSFGSPYIVHSLHGSALLSIGTIATGYAIGIALFSLVGGFLFDRYSVKNTVMLAVGVFSVFTVLTGFVANAAELFSFRLLVGIGVGMFQPAGIALLGDIFYETRGRAVSVWATFFGGGLFASPYMIQPFLPAFRTPFIISGLIAAAVLLLVYLVIPGTYKKVEKRQNIGFSGIFNRNVIALAASVFFFGIALFAGYIGYYSDYLVNGLGISSGHAAVIASAAGLGGFLLAFLLGSFSDRAGRRGVVMLTSFFVLAGSVGMFMGPAYYPLLVASTFIFGAGWGIYVDLLVALGQDSVKDAVVGSVSGFLFFAFNAGTMIGGPLYGTAMGASDFTRASAVAVIVPAALAFLLLFATRSVNVENTGEKSTITKTSQKVDTEMDP